MRFACCNELLEDWPLERQFRFLRDVGYEGIEVAAFTLAPRITDVTTGQRAAVRRLAADVGVEITGLHFLLARTEGLYPTSPDAAVRRLTADYLRALVDCCADIDGQFMVFGSPQQRNLPEGVSVEDGRRALMEVLHAALPAAADAGVTICLEPLPPPQSNFVRTTDEAISIIAEVNHQHLRLILDGRSLAAQAQTQQQSLTEIIRTTAGYTAYCQANDANSGGPGAGDTDFVEIFSALYEIGYDGWMSVEAFDFSPGPENVARDSLAYMQRAHAAAVAG
ncbi:MAG: sugar phosphate isomerase/epimerase [Chloroflexota bacterium]|nr:sugar phosphate isomerase/epimerase [Chloroflexota bacterium]